MATLLLTEMELSNASRDCKGICKNELRDDDTIRRSTYSWYRVSPVIASECAAPGSPSWLRPKLH